VKTVADLCHEIGWSLQHLAAHLNLNGRTVRRWADGTNPVPGNIYRWLYVLAEVHEMCPFPDGWVNQRAPSDVPLGVSEDRD